MILARFGEILKEFLIEKWVKALYLRDFEFFSELFVGLRPVGRKILLLRPQKQS